jgi:hypothetical protein
MSVLEIVLISYFGLTVVMNLVGVAKQGQPIERPSALVYAIAAIIHAAFVFWMLVSFL